MRAAREQTIAGQASKGIRTYAASTKPNSTFLRASSPSGPPIFAASISRVRIEEALRRLRNRARWTVEYGAGNWERMYDSISMQERGGLMLATGGAAQMLMAPRDGSAKW